MESMKQKWRKRNRNRNIQRIRIGKQTKRNDIRGTRKETEKK